MGRSLYARMRLGRSELRLDKTLSPNNDRFLRLAPPRLHSKRGYPERGNWALEGPLQVIRR